MVPHTSTVEVVRGARGDVELFSEAQIGDMLDVCAALGFDLNLVPSPLEDLTLRELDILTRATRGAN